MTSDKLCACGAPMRRYARRCEPCWYANYDARTRKYRRENRGEVSISGPTYARLFAVARQRALTLPQLLERIMRGVG